MKRRLRKKLGKGEFKKFGFKLNIHLTKALEPAEEEKFADEFIVDVVEANGLEAFGVLDQKEFFLFVTDETEKEPNPKAVEAVEKWLKSNELVDKFDKGELEDANA